MSTTTVFVVPWARRVERASQVQAEIADRVGLAKKDVGAVLDELENVIQKNLKPRGPQEFRLPAGLLKIAVKKRPATKAREGRKPATGETITIPPKPANKRVKVTPLKDLKQMI